MYYFIVNPHSRSGRGMDLWKKTEKILNEKEIDYEVCFTEHIGHAQEIARKIAARSVPCTLGVLGGDGTLNEVINGLVSTEYSHITLGYIPTGSGNDFARGLGLSTDIETRINAIISPQESVFADIGLAKTDTLSRYFLVSSGIGYDADICRHVMISKFKKILNKLHIGKLIYVFIALRELVAYKTCSVSVRMDKKEVLRFPNVLFIAGMNLKYEGGGIKFCPDAEYDDNLLDFCLADSLPKPKILLMLPTAFFGKHTRFKGVHMKKCSRMDIVSKTPLPLHCDGEVLGFTERLTLMASGKRLSVIIR